MLHEKRGIQEGMRQNPNVATCALLVPSVVHKYSRPLIAGLLEPKATANARTECPVIVLDGTHHDSVQPHTGIPLGLDPNWNRATMELWAASDVITQQAASVCIQSTPIASRYNSLCHTTGKTVLKSKEKEYRPDAFGGIMQDAIPPAPIFVDRVSKSVASVSAESRPAAATPLQEVRINQFMFSTQQNVSPRGDRSNLDNVSENVASKSCTTTPFIPKKKRRTRRVVESPLSVERPRSQSLNHPVNHQVILVSSPDQSLRTSKPGRQRRGIQSPLLYRFSPTTTTETVHVDLVNQPSEYGDLTRLRRMSSASSPLKPVHGTVVIAGMDQQDHQEQSHLERLVDKKSRGRKTRPPPRNRSTKTLNSEAALQTRPTRKMNTTGAALQTKSRMTILNPFIENEAEESLSDGEGGRIDRRLVVSDNEDDLDPELDKDLEGFVCSDDEIAFSQSANPDFIAQHHPQATQVIAMYHESIKNRNRPVLVATRAGRYYRIQDILEFEDWETPDIDEEALNATDASFVVDDDGAGYADDGSDDLWTSGTDDDLVDKDTGDDDQADIGQGEIEETNDAVTAIAGDGSVDQNRCNDNVTESRHHGYNHHNAYRMAPASVRPPIQVFRHSTVEELTEEFLQYFDNDLGMD